MQTSPKIISWRLIPRSGNNNNDYNKVAAANMGAY